jgi:hypothetical protein
METKGRCDMGEVVIDAELHNAYADLLKLYEEARDNSKVHGIDTLRNAHEALNVLYSRAHRRQYVRFTT